MTANWFECKIKYTKVTEDGKGKKVSEMYLLDAISYTEAESRITEALASIIQGDFYIAGLKKSNITELVESTDEQDDKWYKAKVGIIDADQISGKEKKSNQYFLVAGASINKALANLEKSLSTYVVPYEIDAISDTTFMDVFPYFSGDTEQQIPEHLTPMSDFEQEEKVFE